MDENDSTERHKRYVTLNQKTRHELIEAHLELVDYVDGAIDRLLSVLDLKGRDLHHLIRMASNLIGDDARRAALLEQIRWSAIAAITTDLEGKPVDWRETVQKVVTLSGSAASYRPRQSN